MVRRSSAEIDRRKLLKGLAASAGAGAATSTLVAARGTDHGEDALARGEVKTLLEAAGNPEVRSTTTNDGTVDNVRVVQTEITTDTGTLIHTEFLSENGEIPTAAFFKFDELSGVDQPKLPRSLRAVPNTVELGLVYHEGEVFVRRTATSGERRALESAVDVDDPAAADISAVYCERLGGFYLEVASDDDEVVYEITDASGNTLPYGASAAAAVRAGDISVTKQTEISPDLDCAVPCGECVASTSVCGLCTWTCLGGPVTAPVCIACIVYTCGYSSVKSCVCCLHCYDGVYDDCGPWIPDST